MKETIAKGPTAFSILGTPFWKGSGVKRDIASESWKAGKRRGARIHFTHTFPQLARKSSWKLLSCPNPHPRPVFVASMWR